MTDIEEPRHGAATFKAVAPLIVVNSLAVYGQLAYAYESISPAAWPVVFRVLLAVGFAAATESVALYVQWHAHDALLLKSHATARQLRRWSFLIAACVAAMNYSHFAAPGMRVTAAAVAFGMLSLLSPWMWGLHTRRAARVQLLKERRADEGGADFSSERRRAFPIHTWRARRWSIWNNVPDPKDAWTGYVASIRPAERPSLVDAVLPPVRVRPSGEVGPFASALLRPSGGKAAAWNVEKAVQMIMRGDASPQDIMDATGVGAKPLQLARRAVRFLAEGLDVDAVAAKVPCSLAHVQRVKAAMA